MVSNYLIVSTILLLRFGLYSAQSPEPPISQGTCDALKSIAAGTAGSFIAECTVEEGCGTLDCENQATGSSILTVRPCSDPPFIEVEFYNTSDALLLVQNLTGNHTIPFGSNALIFSVAQLSGAIGLKVDVLAGVSMIPYIPYTVIPIDYDLCSGNTNNVSPTPTMSATYTPMPSESPTGTGHKEVVTISWLLLLVICSLILV